MKPSDQEVKLMEDYILLPIAITVVNTNRLEMETSSITLRKLYSDTATIMMSRMREELSGIRQQLKERQIVVMDAEEEVYEEDCAQFPYILHGYPGMLALNREVIQSGVLAYIHRYVAEVVHFVALEQAKPENHLANASLLDL